MLLTISTSHELAADIGYLLHKHPDRFQSFDLSFDTPHVFYPEVTQDRCSACLLLDVVPVGMVRGKNRSQSFLLGHYVNDRPYVASSFLPRFLLTLPGTGCASVRRPTLAASPGFLIHNGVRAMRSYAYVGPDEIRSRSSGMPLGKTIATVDDLHSWLTTADRESKDATTVATFVISLDGHLRLANRRSEHVACAGGDPVLSAGEITFYPGELAEVVDVTNQSTGYCPQPESWGAVEAALNTIGISHPGAFTTEIVFRRCKSCDQINIVKDDWYICSVCDSDLPSEWNFEKRNDR